ncbi:MAG TPA: thrombospondin type 3 repeat-containing protein [Thermoanaerobaculia bacterium]
MNWKTWSAAALIIVAVFAIYTFAAPEAPVTAPAANAPNTTTARRTPPRSANATPASRATPTATTTASGDPVVHLEWLEAQSGSYESRRNLFAYKEPPPPPPPPPVKPPPPPPDKDGDGIPDFRDNCPDVANPDQQDIDRDGIGTACETEKEIVPPPPPPPLPQFTYKYIGTFGNQTNTIASFARDGNIVNARVGDVIEGKFVLRRIGLESVEIGFVGFPPDQRKTIPLGSQ